MGGLILEEFLKIAGNYFFPMVLSVYLVFKIDSLITALVRLQKEFSENILCEIKGIKQDILEIRLDINKFLNK